MIPVAALIGLMFMVPIGTFEWSSFRIFRRIPLSDAIVLLTVSVMTVFFDLAIAVIAGVIVAALVFAWDNAVRIRARKWIDDEGVKHYEVYGPLFFGSVALFQEKFDLQNDPLEIVIDFKESRIVVNCTRYFHVFNAIALVLCQPGGFCGRRTAMHGQQGDQERGESFGGQE